MDLPPSVALQVSCEDEVDLSGLIIGMRISTGRKNPYHVYFPKTDTSGRSVLSESNIRGQFTDHWESGLMDHSGGLEDASQRVEFFLFDTEVMRRNLSVVSKWPLLPYESTVWNSRQEAVDYYLSCRNAQFRLGETSLVIPRDGEVSLQVREAHGV
jgi:hypothetical protein